MKKEGKLHNSIMSKNIYIGFLKQHFWTWILGPLDPHWGLDWVRHYRSWVVQCSPPLLPEGWGRCQTEGQRRPQPDPRGARQFRVNKPSAFSEWLWEGGKICRQNRCWRTREEEGQVWRGICENTAQIQKQLSGKCSVFWPLIMCRCLFQEKPHKPLSSPTSHLLFQVSGWGAWVFTN